jgi:putative addiction module component (TIGR02574 family)
MTLQDIIEEAKKLSDDEKVDLIDELYCMINKDQDVGLTPAQAQDLDRRIEEYEAGKAKMIPGDEVMERLRKRL